MLLSGDHRLLVSLCRRLSIQLQLIKLGAGNNSSGHTKILPGSTAWERLSSGFVFVWIVDSVTFVCVCVCVPFLVSCVQFLPDIGNVILFAHRQDFWRVVCFARSRFPICFSFSRPISFRYRLSPFCCHKCNIVLCCITTILNCFTLCLSWTASYCVYPELLHTVSILNCFILCLSWTASHCVYPELLHTVSILNCSHCLNTAGRPILRWFSSLQLALPKVSAWHAVCMSVRPTGPCGMQPKLYTCACPPRGRTSTVWML
jgi:hypothetical protein